MSGCPDIDNISLRRNGFGQVGVPIHPSGGLVFGRNGLELNSVAPTYNEGVPDITIRYSGFPYPVPLSQKTNLNSSYSRVGDTVTVLFTWNLNASPSVLDASIEWELPFEAASPLIAHAFGRIRDVGVGNYPQYVFLKDNLTLWIAHNATMGVDPATTGDPAILVGGDSIFFVAQYECKPDAQLLWS